ncbi:MAG: hypothetical protein PHX43_01565 [Alphaproteobacteria bacterium]|nr:hypothetical protein [Alphaproteobacteria bacterium]
MASSHTTNENAMTVNRQPYARDLETSESSSEQRLIEWLLKSKKTKYGAKAIKAANDISAAAPDDWQTVDSICGHQAEDFLSAGVELPLTASEIDYFRRNHRDVDYLVTRDFMVSSADLPSPLSELYALYRHRAHVDTEAALFVAQATGSTRVASIMADLLSIGSFANGLEFISHMTMTYAVSAAFDTSDLIDRANQEAARRLTLQIDHPAHLLTLSPDEISVLASNIVERHMLSSPDFLEKANLLAEARQDVNRLPQAKQFVTAIGERDLPMTFPWISRICAAYARIFESWVLDMPEIAALMNQKTEIRYQ